jgi:hypothetical protein
MSGKGLDSGGVIISIYAPDTDLAAVLAIAQRAADVVAEELGLCDSIRPGGDEFQVNVQTVITTYDTGTT